jgi:predicted nucleotidyltransferase
MVAPKDIQVIADTILDAVPAESIYLFGSYAYGTPGPSSDYDFFIVVPDNSMRPIEAMRKAQRALAANKRTKPIDVLAATRMDFARRRAHPNSLEYRVAHEGILLHG